MNQIFQPFLRKSSYSRYLSETSKGSLKAAAAPSIETQPKKLENLGHIISQEGVAADPMNVEAMKVDPWPFGAKPFQRGQQKSVYKHELMAILQAVQKWKHYLMGSHFVIVTDQKSLIFLTGQWLLIEEQFKWASKLIGYDFEIHFRPGKENQVVDVLSRRDYFMADAKLVSLIQELVLNYIAREGYELKKGRLFYHDKLVLPKKYSHISGIIKELPAFHLEDKVTLHGRGIDKFSGKVYVKRNKGSR
ncbi:hypothetical protein V8G54_037985 (chloroplast) [Vigna mungo]|uniref:Reverse transcriptase RNase H-like domain-containing protein n=1 Tax=Vigna mungo TaxID=3915 RepID=A0AAQ3ME48_VIGMU